MVECRLAHGTPYSHTFAVTQACELEANRNGIRRMYSNTKSTIIFIQIQTWLWKAWSGHGASKDEGNRRFIG